MVNKKYKDRIFRMVFNDERSGRMEGLELQLKSTEKVLKNQIIKSESMVLDEVERVHKILDKHKNDQSKYTA